MLVFVVGTPVLLIAERAGSPVTAVGRFIRSPGSTFHALGGPVTDSMVVHVAVLLAWLVLVLVGPVPAGRGRGPRRGGGVAARLPASRHAQTVAALLVGATIALVPTARMHATTRLAAVGSTLPISPSALVADRMTADDGRFLSPGSGCGTAGAENASESGQGAPVERDYVVRRGDTMWSIAGKELGSPLRWREIAALNLGRIQSDGQELSHAGLILPGWSLQLPPVELRPGFGSDSELARPKNAGALGSPRRKPQIPEGSSGRREKQAEVPRRTPSKESDPTDVVQTTQQPTTEHGPTATPGSGQSSPQSHRDPPEHGREGLPVAPFGYGLLGAGIVGLINRLRRAQQRRRPDGMRIARPDRTS